MIFKIIMYIDYMLLIMNDKVDIMCLLNLLII